MFKIFNDQSAPVPAAVSHSGHLRALGRRPAMEAAGSGAYGNRRWLARMPGCLLLGTKFALVGDIGKLEQHTGATACQRPVGRTVSTRTEVLPRATAASVCAGGSWERCFCAGQCWNPGPRRHVGTEHSPPFQAAASPRGVPGPPGSGHARGIPGASAERVQRLLRLHHQVSPGAGQ